jgi:hypothetical protein
MNDPIVDEVRKVRDAHAARFQYDLDAIFHDIKDQESQSGRSFVTFAPQKPTRYPVGATHPLVPKTTTSEVTTSAVQ